MDSATNMKYSLKWKNFEGIFTSQFETLKEDEDFVDVTLSCCGQSIKAHKVVLSACSPYLKRLFKEHPCKHPIIILEYLNFTNLAGLIQFIYTGQVNVEQHELPEFLKAAEILQIRGLTESPEINCLWQANQPPGSQSPGSSPPPKKRSKECDSQIKKCSNKKKRSSESSDKDSQVIEYDETDDKNVENEGNNENEENKEDKDDNKGNEHNRRQINETTTNGNNEGNEDKHQLTICENDNEENSKTPKDCEEMEESVQFQYKSFPSFDECFPEHLRQSHWSNQKTCPLCHRTYSSTSNLRQHMKLIHNPTLVTCSICFKTFKTALYLRRHLIHFHEVEPGANVVAVECNAIVNQSPNTSLNAVGYRRMMAESESCEIID